MITRIIKIAKHLGIKTNVPNVEKIIERKKWIPILT